METKMTSRDKVLLIVLAIVLVIFGAIMIPTYGIKDLIVNMNETRDKIKAQTITNEETLRNLSSAGISAAYAENYAQAKRALNKKILQTKYDAVKMQQTSLSAKAYAVAEQWLTPVKYLHFDAGNTEMYANVNITNNSSGFNSSNITVTTNTFEVERYGCSFTCSVAGDEKYVLELDHLDVESDVDELSLLVAIYTILEERGSVTIKDWSFNDGNISIGMELVIPHDSQIDDYAAQIGECHVCGTPYYISDYQAQLADLPEGETQVKCSNEDCNNGDPAVLTGEALN